MNASIPSHTTLSLIETAAFLGIHKETARRLAANQEIPGAKIGRSWRFVHEDLVTYMRHQYSSPASRGVIHRRNEQWHSSNEVKCGGLTSHTKVSEYEELLELAAS